MLRWGNGRSHRDEPCPRPTAGPSGSEGLAMTSDAGPPGAPHFDVVFRGYDRRQVDEHVARLHRVIARMRADLSARGPVGDRLGPPPGSVPPGWPPGRRCRRPDTPRTPSAASPTACSASCRPPRRRPRRSATRPGSRPGPRASRRAQLDELVRERERMLRELAQIRGQLPEADRTARMPRPGLAPPNEPRARLPSPRPRPPAPGPGPVAQAPPPPPPMAPAAPDPGAAELAGPAPEVGDRHRAGSRRPPGARCRPRAADGTAGCSAR